MGQIGGSSLAPPPPAGSPVPGRPPTVGPAAGSCRPSGFRSRACARRGGRRDQLTVSAQGVGEAAAAGLPHVAALDYAPLALS